MAKQKAQGNRVSKKLTQARQVESTAIALARDVKTLLQWLNHDVLELAGPALVERQELYDFLVAELQCGGKVERVAEVPVQRQQVAELVNQPVEVWEYERPWYECPGCGWQGRSPLPPGCREGFSYGGLLSSLVGWLGYGGHLPWVKRIRNCEFGIRNYNQWGLEPATQLLTTESKIQWGLVPDSIPNSEFRIVVVKSLLGEDFAGILSSDCWSAYSPQAAALKQKCLAHLERELKALETSRFAANREFAERVFPILHTARQAHRDYHQGQLNLAQLQQQRPLVEAQLAQVLDTPTDGRWAADSQNLANRLRRHWSEWFTFLRHPEVKRIRNCEFGIRNYSNRQDG